MSARWLLTPIQKLSSTNSAVPSNPLKYCCTVERKTHKVLDPIGESQSGRSLGHHRQGQLFDVFYPNHPTCAVHLHSEIQPGPGCGSLFLDLFSCPCLFPWAGCDLALSLTCLTIHECLFATGPEMDCSSCTLVYTNTELLCGRFANANCSMHRFFAVNHAREEIRVLYAFFLLPFVPLPFPNLYGIPFGLGLGSVIQ